MRVRKAMLNLDSTLIKTVDTYGSSWQLYFRSSMRVRKRDVQFGFNRNKNCWDLLVQLTALFKVFNEGQKKIDV